MSLIAAQRGEVDEALVNDFLKSPGQREWRLWRCKRASSLPYDTYSTLQAVIPILGLPQLPEVMTESLELFERNDTDLTTRPEFSRGAVSLPALELRFQDPEHPELTYVGFVIGLKNVNRFLRGIIEKSKVGSLEK